MANEEEQGDEEAIFAAARDGVAPSSVAAEAPERPPSEPLHAAEITSADYVDVEMLLARCAENREFAWGLLREFRTQLPDFWRNLSSAAEARDAEQLKSAAHHLKGVAGNMSAQAVYGGSSRIVEALRHRPDVGGVQHEISALQQSVEATLQHLDQLIGQLPA